MTHCSRVLTLLGVSLCLLTAQPTAHARSSQELEELLAAPVTAGIEALLIRHVADARVPRRWIGHARHAEPSVRAAAARALGVTGVGAAIGPLRVALAAEQDGVARAEQALALIVLGGGAHDAFALAKLAAGDSATLELGLRAVAALRPATLAGHVGRLTAAPPERTLPLRHPVGRLLALVPDADRQAFVVEATTQGGALLGALLQAAAVHQQILPVATLEAAAAAPSVASDLLVYTAWQYTKPGVPLRPGGAPALRPEMFASSDTAAADERMAHELIRRWLGQQASVDVSGHFAEVSAKVGGWPTWVFTPLSDEERKAFLSRFEHRSRDWAGPAQGIQKSSTEASAVTLVSALPSGLHRALAAASGCRATDEHDRFAEIAYRSDGRPQQIQLIAGKGTTRLPDGCQAMLETIVALAFESPGEDEPMTHLTLIRLDQEFGACQALDSRLSAQAPSGTGAVPGADTDASPTKTRDVKPVYQSSALRDGIQGVVIVKMLVTKAGCVGRARVTRRLVPALDLAAIRAASRWEYRPLLIDGAPASFELTAFVNFVLR